MSKEKQLQDEPPVLENKPNNGLAVVAMLRTLANKLNEKRLERQLPVLENESNDGIAVIAYIRMVLDSIKGAKVLQDGGLREKMLIDLASHLNNLHVGHSKKLVKVGAFGTKKIFAATSYDVIQFLLKYEGGLERIFLQDLLASRIGSLLASEGKNYDDAVKRAKPYTPPGTNHVEIAQESIAETFDEFRQKLTSEEGMPATTLTIEMIYRVMTGTVFGGYTDPVVKSWKDRIVYYLKELNRVQLPYAAAVLAENYPENLPEDLSKKIPQILQRKPSSDLTRKFMRLVAKIQGISDVLENMVEIEDKLFPEIVQWIEDQVNKTDEELADMGFLGAVILAHRKGLDINVARSEIFGIYTAALDSTANAANWLLAEFAQHPEILTKVASLEGDDRKKYILFILYELWRKDPITPIIFRQVAAGKGITMPDGTYLKPGDIALLSVGAAGYNKELYTDPEVFNPDRYEQMTSDQLTQVKKDSGTVFAAGSEHRCKGEGAVYQSMKTLIEWLADNVESIVIVPKKKGQKVNVESNKSGVRSPVNDGEPLNLRVVFKKMLPSKKIT